MEISVKSITLFAAIAITGLSAGLFYAWSVSVIPGTRKIMDLNYMETMQSINRAILNPAFFLIFFGALILLATSALQHFHAGSSFWFLLAATVFYFIGTIGVTGLGNVPLNNELDALELNSLNDDQLTEFRKYYESKWNLLHNVRTVFAVLSFLLSLMAVFTSNKH